MRKKTDVRRPPFFHLILLSAVFLLCGCAVADLTDQPVGTEDSALAVRAKAALIRSLELNAAAIDVEAVEGGVRLRGFVENDTQKATAERIAGQVEGVGRVINEIEIK